MKFHEGFFSSFHHFTTYPLRTALTLLGMVVGAASIVAMIGIGEGTRIKIIDDMEKLGGTGLIVVQNDPHRVRASAGTSGQWRLSWKDHEHIRSASSLIAESAPIAVLETQYSSRQNRAGGPCLGVTPAFFKMREWPVLTGRILHELDMRNTSRTCVLGQEVSAKLFPGGTDPIGQTVTIGGREDFTVVGVMSEHQVEGAQWMNQQVITPITTFQERLTGNMYLERILVKALETEHVPLITEQIRRVLEMNHENPDWYRIYSQTKVINTVKSSTTLLRFSFGTIALIVLFIGGIGIMNLMLVSVTERTREIGIRKAVGAKNSDIFIQFLLESFMLTWIGGAVGIVLGIWMGDLFAMLVARFLGDQVMSVITFQTLFLAAFSVVAIGAVFGSYPAFRAARLDPGRAVSYE